MLLGHQTFHRSTNTIQVLNELLIFGRDIIIILMPQTRWEQEHMYRFSKMTCFVPLPKTGVWGEQDTLTLISNAPIFNLTLYG